MLLTLETFAKWVMNVWSFAGVVLFLFGWLNIPVLAVFAFHRAAQLRDPNFDLRPTLPTHIALHHYCAALYGVILPAFYFLTVRLRHELAMWHLGSNVNHRWTIALGMICVVWLAAKLFRAIHTGDSLRFGGRFDRVMAGVAVALCVWFHFWTLIEMPIALQKMKGQSGGSAITAIFVGCIYPQSHFLGAMLVYCFAFIEALKTPTVPMLTLRRRATGWALSISAIVLIFAPWWLSLPRVTHQQALAMIKSNRGSIIEIAKGAELDPRLIAGIIYVAQTRDHPRWTGDFIDTFGMQLDHQSGSLFYKYPVFDGSVGLCQMRPSTYVALRGFGSLPQINTKARVNSPVSMINALPTNWPPDYRSIAAMKFSARTPSTIRFTSYNFTKDESGWLAGDAKNITCAAMMLHLLSDQWRQAGHPIDDRPEILATLYNIGFQRSHPHGSPKPNDFGRRVKAFIDSPDCERLFCAKAGKS